MIRLLSLSPSSLTFSLFLKSTMKFPPLSSPGNPPAPDWAVIQGVILGSRSEGEGRLRQEGRKSQGSCGIVLLSIVGPQFCPTSARVHHATLMSAELGHGQRARTGPPGQQSELAEGTWCGSKGICYTSWFPAAFQMTPVV